VSETAHSAKKKSSESLSEPPKKKSENSNDKWGSLLNICRKTLFPA